MAGIIATLLGALLASFKPRTRLCLENLALRHQLAVLRRTAPRRVPLRITDRLLFAWLYRLWPGVLEAMAIVRPETVLRWHRDGFRAYWRWKSRSRVGRPRVPREVRALIRQMSLANRLWGAPRIHGELLKLGIEVAQSTVAKYMVKCRLPPSQNWATFLRNRRLRGLGIRDRPVAPRSPWQNGHAERLIGSIRRECLDHMIVLGGSHLRRITKNYVTYYNVARTHLSLDKDSPIRRPVESMGCIVAQPMVGGLHRRYARI